jgi:hypothetical protein
MLASRPLRSLCGERGANPVEARKVADAVAAEVLARVTQAHRVGAVATIEVDKLDVVVFPATDGTDGERPRRRLGEREKVTAGTRISPAAWGIPPRELRDKVKHPRGLPAARYVQELAEDDQ